MIIEIIILSIKAFEKRQLNHLPTYNHSFKEVYFEINNIKYIEHDIVEYTAIISFFKKQIVNILFMMNINSTIKKINTI